MISWVVYTVTSSQTHQCSVGPGFAGEAIDLFRLSGNMLLAPASSVDLESHQGLAGQSATSVMLQSAFRLKVQHKNVNKLAMFIDVIAIISHGFIKICQVWDNFKNIIFLYCDERCASQKFVINITSNKCFCQKYTHSLSTFEKVVKQRISVSIAIFSK